MTNALNNAEYALTDSVASGRNDEVNSEYALVDIVSPGSNARTNVEYTLADLTNVLRTAKANSIAILVDIYLEQFTGVSVSNRLRHGGGLIDGVLYPFGSES